MAWRMLPPSFVVLALLGLCVLTTPWSAAFADEAARVAEGTALAERIANLRKAKDRTALEPELAKVPTLHNALDDKGLRARLQEVLGDVLAEAELGSARQRAAEALAACHDEKVWAQLKRVFPAVDVEAGLPVHVSVVAAAGKVAAPAAATPLLDLARKVRDPNLVRAAVEALAGFGWARNRATVLVELADLIPLTEGGAAGGSRGAKVSPETAAAWRSLRPVLLQSLNELTGRSEASLELWTALLKEHKKKPEALFVRAR